jgi:Na+/glutamate symporter
MTQQEGRNVPVEGTTRRELPAQLSPSPQPEGSPSKGPSKVVINVLTVLVGLILLAIGIGWIIYSWVVNKEIPYFGIPLIMTVPVIGAVAFRNCWD